MAHWLSNRHKQYAKLLYDAQRLISAVMLINAAMESGFMEYFGFNLIEAKAMRGRGYAELRRSRTHTQARHMRNTHAPTTNPVVEFYELTMF